MKIRSLTFPFAAMVTFMAAVVAPEAAPTDRHAAASTSTASTQATPVYSVKDYDPKRNPAKDLEATIKQARAANRKILVQVGGDWCGWCKRLQAFFHEKPELAKALNAGFVIMKVNYSEKNENEKFLSQYPEIAAFPHLFVLDAEGKLLKSQDAEIFEKQRSYDEEKLLAFLIKWSAAK